MADKCNYRDASGAFPCPRPRAVSDRCHFHNTDNANLVTSDDFKARLLGLIEAKDGDWKGFVFPGSFTFERLNAEFVIDLTRAQFGAFAALSCNFTEVNFSSATFNGPAEFKGCTFTGLTCSGADFAGDLLWSSIVNGPATFSQCRFRQPVRIWGQFNGPAFWGQSSFYDSIEFTGGWIGNLSTNAGKAPVEQYESHGLFAGETSLQSIDFRRPERARFSKVNLGTAYVVDTDFRGVSFHDVTWPTIQSRRAIYDEIWHSKLKIPHPPVIGKLEPAYRTIRICYEEGKDFSTASDFYVGEMEARRRQFPWYRRYLLSIEAMYCFLSGYGCNSMRAFVVLLGLLGAHALATGSLLHGAGFALPDPGLAAESIKRTLTLLSPLPTVAKPEALDEWWFLLDVAFGLLAVMQTALFVLSLRSRIKRG